MTVEEHRPAGDEHGTHGVVVAIHHPGQVAVLVDRFLGVGVQDLIQPLWVYDDQIGTVADPQMAGIDAVPVRQLTRETMHGVLDSHERSTRPRGVPDVAQ